MDDDARRRLIRVIGIATAMLLIALLEIALLPLSYATPIVLVTIGIGAYFGLTQIARRR